MSFAYGFRVRKVNVASSSKISPKMPVTIQKKFVEKNFVDIH
jgi:hypothetical protein